MIIELKGQKWSTRLMRRRADKIVIYVIYIYDGTAAGHTQFIATWKIKYQFFSFMGASSSAQAMSTLACFGWAHWYSYLKYENFRYPITGSRTWYILFEFIFFLSNAISPRSGGCLSSVVSLEKWRKELNEGRAGKKCNIAPRLKVIKKENSISQFEK